MFIPLHDANSLKRIKLQYVTIGLIAVNVVVYFFTSLGSEQFAVAAVYSALSSLRWLPSMGLATSHRWCSTMWNCHPNSS
jgi:membrane associated rhomboid family serine protease